MPPTCSARFPVIHMVLQSLCAEMPYSKPLRMQLPGHIAALACKGDLTFAAVGSAVHVCRRMHLVHTWRSAGGAILQLLVMGDFVLALQRGGQLTMWNAQTLEVEPVVRTLFCSTASLFSERFA